jgi:hypothetical protein
MLAAKEIVEDVTLGIRKTSSITMLFISLKVFLHFPSEIRCSCVLRWMATLDRSDNE